MVKINASFPINMFSYGLCGINFLKQLDNLGYELSLFPIGQMEADQEHHPLISKCLANADDYNRRAPSLRLMHANNLSQHVGKGLNIGMTIFELDKFTKREKCHLNNQDKIVIPTQWAKNILIENKILNDIDLHVVNLGVDRNIFPAKTKQIEGPTRFITCGKLEIRKSNFELLEFFEAAFNKNDDVQLILVCGSKLIDQMFPEEKRKWLKLYSESVLADKIRFVDWLPTQNHVAKLMQESDCFISLSKAEGWNLGALESFSTGLPVIITNLTGHTEFCNSTNSMLVEGEGTELAIDNCWFNGETGARWSSLGDNSKEQTVEYLRSVHCRKQSGENLFNQAGVETACKFSWEAAGKKLSEIL